MSTQETDGVRSFAASNSFVEDLPQPVEGNMQDIPKSLLRNSMIESRVGMEFDSLLQVTEFYKNYAYSKGFATITRSSRKNKGFAETSYINLKCNREGRYNSLVDVMDVTLVVGTCFLRWWLVHVSFYRCYESKF